jgi:hypothetical protein
MLTQADAWQIELITWQERTGKGANAKMKIHRHYAPNAPHGSTPAARRHVRINIHQATTWGINQLENQSRLLAKGNATSGNRHACSAR